MQLKSGVAFALVSISALASPASLPEAQVSSSGFPSDIQAGILNIQNYINGVINDIVQSSPSLPLDYSSGGRSLAFLERSILPNGCKQNLPKPAKTAKQAISYLQSTQLTLSQLSLDAINSNLAKGKKDVCLAVNTYGGAASYVQSVIDSQ
ncbi:hypothetical protein K431DRAFT_287252 [Polychaeton citri CBS 116435]|uniref:Uncharacterized protein n=1 Tax=Polychaeton citri CBS 116435 TaxID=1314669 RepID=A0A9P4UKD8_9PEZI|nr:hypothetical protein K431DRAFT_287252 [Polychaeton citri CBS 116435]